MLVLILSAIAVYHTAEGELTVSVWSNQTAYPQGFLSRTSKLSDGISDQCMDVSMADMGGHNLMLGFQQDFTTMLVNLEASGTYCSVNEAQDCDFPTMLLREEGIHTDCAAGSYFCGPTAQCTPESSTQSGTTNTVCSYRCVCPEGETCKKMAFVFGPSSFKDPGTPMRLCEITINTN